MSVRGFMLVILATVIQVSGNLMLRDGVVRAGGLSLSLATLFSELKHLALQPVFDVGVVLYGVSSLIWFGVVSSENLNAAYPIVVSLSFLLVTLGSTLFFHESISMQKGVGIFVLLVGITLVATAK